LSKLDFDTAEELLIKWLRQVAAVAGEQKECDAVVCSESMNDFGHVCLMPVKDEDRWR
jgi:hypothetical protein